jgi:GNAT superfamily N-acetyltransferase
MEVRRARLSDAEGIATAHVRSWQAAYAGLVPQAYLDGLDLARRTAAWEEMLAHPGDREVTLVAEEAGNESGPDIVGFVAICPSRDDDAGDVGEVAAIYLLAEVWGRGYGRALMAAALCALKELGFSSATLWALEGNQRARTFYEAGGWSTDGAVRQDSRRGATLSEVRYRHPLVDQS